MIRQKKFDGVIDTVHYAADGQIEWVRAYERVGFVFTDILTLDRQTLINRLKDGARFFIGKRMPYVGNEFELSEKVRLEGKKGAEFVVVGETKGNKDSLEGVPIF
ncbi:MAG: hypothetical protein ISR58_07545 [Anaerolineales bacterium]|nr:hypothetical protein [Chloroflexota bacterium]MBL6981030.1 hypothetical protein [Anaerolineales bacterium]